ncbi:DUF6331 family protein [Cupriavidus basilensis]
MANEGDIGIGEDKWIPFIDLQGKYHDAADIDDWLAPILPLLDWLETECVADCCGIDAYGFWPDAIARAAMQAGLPDLAERIAQVRERVASSGGDVFLSHRMNNYFDRQVLLQLIDHIAACLASGARDREPY